MGNNGPVQDRPIAVSSLPTWLLLLSLAPLLVWDSASAQDAAVFFRTNCYSCHTIGGGRVTGPDLKNVTERQDRDWLIHFMLNPKQVIDSGDPYARELLKEARNVIMPNIPNLDEAMAQALLDLIERESRLEESNFMGLQVSDRPLSMEEVEEGRKFFLGYLRFSGGAPSCFSCHSVGHTGPVGGGRIGPDLTKVYERLGGRQALVTWLLSPGNATMRALLFERALTQEEIASLSAFLEYSAKNAEPADAVVASTNFLLVGLLLTAAMFLLGSALQRRSLVQEQRESNTAEDRTPGAE